MVITPARTPSAGSWLTTAQGNWPSQRAAPASGFSAGRIHTAVDTTVLAGTLRFNIASGTPTIAAGVTATVASGATLELAGSVSALGTAGGNRVHVINDSTAPGVLVSGTGQIVGGIDGTGDAQVNDGSDLTADHIIQNALIIGGRHGSPGVRDDRRL